MSAMHGYLRFYMLTLAACIGLAVPALAQDNSGLAVGKGVWTRGGCFNCHGERGQGGDGGDYPVGPSFSKVTYDKATMVEVVSCGRPGTPMPAWLKDAYTNVACYGMPVGSIPSGVTAPAIFTADEIKALVDYIFATFVQTPQR